MWNWLLRGEQRRSELERGVDADLVHANRSRWKVCYILFGASMLLLALRYLTFLPLTLVRIAQYSAAVLLAGAVLVAQWARAEAGFLNRPDPKEPPRIWK